MAENTTGAGVEVAGAAVVDPKAAAAAVVDPKKAAEAAAATEEIIVNGKPVKVTPAQLRALAQKGYFADQRIKSADVLKGKTEALINALKTPEGFLQILKDPALGASPKEVFKALMASDIIDDELKEEMSQWVYQNVVQTAQLTPEQQEDRRKLQEYTKLKAEKEARDKADLTKQQQAKVDGIRQAVVAEINKQIVNDKAFPKIEGSIRAVVEKLRVMNKQGAPVTIENVTKAIGLVKKDFLVHQQSIFDAIEDPEALIAHFGEDRALKISKALVARLQAKTKAQAKEEKKAEGATIREKVTDRIDKKLGRTAQGYTVLDV